MGDKEEDGEAGEDPKVIRFNIRKCHLFLET